MSDCNFSELAKVHLTGMRGRSQIPAVFANKPDKIVDTEVKFLTDAMKDVVTAVSAEDPVGQGAKVPRVQSATTAGAPAATATMTFTLVKNTVYAVIMKFDYADNTVAGLDFLDISIAWTNRDGSANSRAFKAELCKGLELSFLPSVIVQAYASYSPIQSTLPAQTITITVQCTQNGVVSNAWLVDAGIPSWGSLKDAVDAVSLLDKIDSAKRYNEDVQRASALILANCNRVAKGVI